MSVDAYITTVFFGYLLVLGRIGSAMMFLPGFGEVQIPVRARLSLALVLCLALYPVVPVIDNPPQTASRMFVLLAAEITIGLWIGLAARTLLSAMQFAGYQVGQVTGLANAFGPSLGTFEGATLMATFLLIGSVGLLFITDTHHIILRALLDSYYVFPPGLIMAGDLAQQMVKVGGHSLYIGTSIAAPFFVMGVILNLGMGLANRMMPQLPVFFVAGAILIGVGLIILAVASPAMIEFFLADFVEWLGTFRL